MQPWMLERGHTDVDVDETGVRAEAPMSRRLDDRAEWWKDMQTTRQTGQEQRSKQTTHVDWDPPSVHVALKKSNKKKRRLQCANDSNNSDTFRPEAVFNGRRFSGKTSFRRYRAGGRMAEATKRVRVIHKRGAAQTFRIATSDAALALATALVNGPPADAGDRTQVTEEQPKDPEMARKAELETPEEKRRRFRVDLAVC